MRRRVFIRSFSVEGCNVAIGLEGYVRLGMTMRDFKLRWCAFAPGKAACEAWR